MKTTFKVIITLFVMFSSLSLVSCKDDDEDKDPAIVGTWVSEVLPVYMDASLQETEPNLEAISYFWYKKDGSFIAVDIVTDTETNNSEYYFSDTGKWSVNGDVVTQTTNYQWDDPTKFDTDTGRFEVKGDILIITAEYAGIVRSIQLKRIKEDKMQEVYSAAKEYHHKLYPNK